MSASPSGTRAGRVQTKHLLVLAGALAAACVTAEIALRFLGRFPPEPVWYVGEFENRDSENFAVDDATGWRMRPDQRFTRPALGREIVYQSDAEGFRCDPDARVPDRELLIAIVGDSQAWGFGVPYAGTFGARLGAALGGARVLNLAQPGYGVDQIGLALRHHGLPREPDLVVVAIFRNDFNRSLQAFRAIEGFNKPTFVLDDGELRRRTAEDRPGALATFLMRSTHLWGLGQRAFEALGIRDADADWQALNFALLDAMVEDLERAGVPALFLSVPRTRTVGFSTFDAWAARAGVHFVDPASTPPATEEELFLPDRHLTEAGHRWVTDCLLAELEASLPELLTDG